MNFMNAPKGVKRNGLKIELKCNKINDWMQSIDDVHVVCSVVIL